MGSVLHCVCHFFSGVVGPHISLGSSSAVDPAQRMMRIARQTEKGSRNREAPDPFGKSNVLLLTHNILPLRHCNHPFSPDNRWLPQLAFEKISAETSPVDIPYQTPKHEEQFQDRSSTTSTRRWCPPNSELVPAPVPAPNKARRGDRAGSPCHRTG